MIENPQHPHHRRVNITRTFVGVHSQSLRIFILVVLLFATQLVLFVFVVVNRLSWTVFLGKISVYAQLVASKRCKFPLLIFPVDIIRLFLRFCEKLEIIFKLKHLFIWVHTVYLFIQFSLLLFFHDFKLVFHFFSEHKLRKPNFKFNITNQSF